MLVISAVTTEFGRLLNNGSDLSCDGCVLGNVAAAEYSQRVDYVCWPALLSAHVLWRVSADLRRAWTTSRQTTHWTDSHSTLLGTHPCFRHLVPAALKFLKSPVLCLLLVSPHGSDSFRSRLMFCWHFFFFFTARSPSCIGRSLQNFARWRRVCSIKT